MERRTLLAVLLAFVVLYVYQSYIAPPSPAPARQAAPVAATTPSTNEAPAAETRTAPPVDSTTGVTVEEETVFETPDVKAVLEEIGRIEGMSFEMMDTSFFLNRETILPSERPGMALWREHLFAWMSRNAATAMDFFRIPPGRVVELGSQVEI